MSVAVQYCVPGCKDAPAVDGYYFVQGKDSFRGDIMKVDAGPPADIAKSCGHDCVAFNTDGYIKEVVNKPLTVWSTAPCEGIYIKKHA